MQLPEELQWVIMGFLSVRSLCTARLVSKDLHRSASCHLKALWIPCKTLQQPPSNIFTQLSGLTRVEVSVEDEAQLHFLSQPRIAPVITHVKVDQVIRLNSLAPLSLASPGSELAPNDLAHLKLLPKLRKLSLQDDISKVELLPLRLEKLVLWGETSGSLSPLNGLLGLKSLTIDVHRSVSSLGSLTALINLRVLQVVCESGPPGMLSTLTRLTELILNIYGTTRAVGSIFPELIHLTGLSSLFVPHSTVDLRLEDLACLAHLTRLTALGLDGSPLAECVTGSSVLVSLTRLGSLGICGGPLGISLLSKVNVKALEWLALTGSCRDISVLQRATRLIWLVLHWSGDGADYLPELGPTLARMSRLCQLVLHLEDEAGSTEVFHLASVLRALTNLTCLDYKGNFTVGDLQACASLPNLRELVLRDTREVTVACVPALQGMSGLNELKLLKTGIHQDELTPEVRARFDVERLRRGWARLKLRCENT
jgi:hypothetical protein